MAKENEADVIERLDAIISILIKSQLEKSSMIEKVRILKRAGIGYKEIAKILSTTPNTISVMFAKINKEDGRQKS